MFVEDVRFHMWLVDCVYVSLFARRNLQDRSRGKMLKCKVRVLHAGLVNTHVNCTYSMDPPPAKPSDQVWTRCYRNEDCNLQDAATVAGGVAVTTGDNTRREDAMRDECDIYGMDLDETERHACAGAGFSSGLCADPSSTVGTGQDIATRTLYV